MSVCRVLKTKRHICATAGSNTVCVQNILKRASLNGEKMSTAMNFGSKTFKPRPPDKGSFPLDHFGECKAFKEKFMKCLRENNYDNSMCRLQSKDYLECRMDHQLMTKEPLEKLGFKDLMDPPPSQAGKDNKA